MMAAYQPQPGGMHPGMAPQGHPAMTPGQPMNPAQMQQMGHPGAVTPGPHVTQAQAMMGMQPGANAMGGPAGMGGQHPGGQMGGMPAHMGGQSMPGGVPNAQALSHMSNQQQALLHQQQQQMMQQHLQNNPQLAAQQQAVMQRRMAAMHANSMAGMPQGMQGLNPQQLQQLQQSQAMHAQGVQLPQHLQLQQIQVARMQQQQQQQQAAAQNQQMQQQLAMQQANSQQSNQGSQPGSQNQQGGQPQQPMRPQSRVANPNEPNQGQPQQAAQQAAQQGQPQQQQQQQQQAQQTQTGQQQSQQQNQQGQQPQTMTQQQLHAMQIQRQRAMQAQQQNAMRQQMQQAQQTQALQVQQQQHNEQGGMFVLKAMSLADGLSNFDRISGKDVALWHAFVDKQFSPAGRLIHSFSFDENSTNTNKKYEIPRATIARYFHSYFDANASHVRLHLENPRDFSIPGNRHQVAFSSAMFTIFHPNGARLELSGNVKIAFAPGLDLIDLMELHTASAEEHIARSQIESLLTNWSPTMGNKQSPKLAKNKVPKAQQKMQSQFEGLTIDHFPKISKGTLGITDRVQHFLEFSETFSAMSDLITFAQERKMRPTPAIEALVESYDAQGQQPNQQGNPQINLPPNGVQVGNRTPSMQHMQMPNAQGGNQFASPSVSNLGLPMQNGIPGMNGSPNIAHNASLAPNMNMPNSHTPSPNQANMAAPPMMPQHSQQGTNSSAASTNTSPNVNNKRRRSTVKMEGEDADANQTGANRVKPSPRIPKKAKPGGA